MGSYPQCLSVPQAREELVNADALSRLPRAGYHSLRLFAWRADSAVGSHVHDSTYPSGREELDRERSRVRRFVMSGWLSSCVAGLPIHPYFKTISCTPGTGLHLSAHTLAGLLIPLIHCVEECCHQKFSSALGGGGGGWWGGT